MGWVLHVYIIYEVLVWADVKICWFDVPFGNMYDEYEANTKLSKIKDVVIKMSPLNVPIATS